MTFEEQLNIGMENEEAMILLPKLRTYNKTLLSRIDMGGAPRMIGPDGRRLGTGIILPDVEMTHQYFEPCAIEFKLKTDSSQTRITGKQEHGIPHRLYLNYLRWQWLHRRQVVLMITEKSTGEVLAATLTKLHHALWTYLPTGRRYYRPRFSDSAEMGKMAFFSRDQFQVFHQSDAVNAPLFKGVPLPPTLPEVGHLQEVLRQ
jgi:hypothetical protein